MGGCGINYLPPTFFRKMTRLEAVSFHGMPIREVPTSLGLRAGTLKVAVMDGLELGSGVAELVKVYVEKCAELRSVCGVSPAEQPALRTSFSAEVFESAASILEGGRGVYPPSMLEIELEMFARMEEEGGEGFEGVSGGRSRQRESVHGSVASGVTTLVSPTSPNLDALKNRNRALKRLLLFLRDCNDLDEHVRRTVEFEREEAVRRRARGDLDRTAFSEKETDSTAATDSISEFGVPVSLLGMGRGGATTPSLRGAPGTVAQVSQGAVKKHKPPEFRMQLVREILATERSYVAGLRGLIELYAAPLEGVGGGERILSKEEHARVFQNVQSLLGLHLWVAGAGARGVESECLTFSFFASLRRSDPSLPRYSYHRLLPSLRVSARLRLDRDHILPALTKACDDGSGRTDDTSLKGRVGKCFLQYSQFLKLYSIYYNGFDNALAFLECLETDNPSGKKDSAGFPLPNPKTTKKFRAHVEKAQQSSKHTQINLQAWLLLPVQRLPRYKMLLEKLWECTDPKHPDNEDLERAVEEISQRVRECNERKREWEGVTSVVEGVMRQIHAPEEADPGSPVSLGQASPPSGGAPGSGSPIQQNRRIGSMGSAAGLLSLARPGTPGSPGSPVLGAPAGMVPTTGSALLKVFSTRRKLLKAQQWRIVRVLVRPQVQDSTFATYFGLPLAPPDVLHSGIPFRSASNIIPPAFFVRNLGGRMKEGIPLLAGTIIPATPKEAGRNDELILFADIMLWCRPIKPTKEHPDQRYELIKAFDLDKAGDAARGVARVVDAADLPFVVPGIPREGDAKLLRIADPGGELVLYAAMPKDVEGENEALSFVDAINFGGSV